MGELRVRSRHAGHPRAGPCKFISDPHPSGSPRRRRRHPSRHRVAPTNAGRTIVGATPTIASGASELNDTYITTPLNAKGDCRLRPANPGGTQAPIIIEAERLEPGASTSPRRHRAALFRAHEPLDAPSEALAILGSPSAVSRETTKSNAERFT